MSLNFGFRANRKNFAAKHCASAATDYLGGMEEFATVQCPFCGQSFDVGVDTTIADQRFTTDCEVCCRPFEITVECADGEILSATVAS